MKKSILAVSVLALSVNALAASNTTITTAKKPTGLNAILKSTSASMYLGAGKVNSEANKTSYSQTLRINNTLTENFSTRLEIRTLSADVDAGEVEANNLTMIDPRLSLYGYAATVKTALGDITINPVLRTEIAINDNAKKQYARFRLGSTASIKTSTANTVTAFAGVYETLAKTDAPRATHEGANFYTWIDNSYSFNDNNSIGATYETFKAWNQDTMALSNKYGENDLTVYYSNTSIKNLFLSPNLGINMDKELKADNVSVGVDAIYSF